MTVSPRPFGQIHQSALLRVRVHLLAGCLGSDDDEEGEQRVGWLQLIGQQELLVFEVLR